MNKMYLVIAVVAGIILIMVFHHTPMSEIQKRREAYKGKMLVQHIIDRNGKLLKEDKKSSIRAGGDTSDDKSPDAPKKNGLPPGLHNPYLTPPQPGQISPQAQPNSQQPAPAQDDYYPPAPAAPGVAPGTKPQSFLHNLFYQRNDVSLADGSVVRFEGSKVYTVGDNGVAHPLKDGQYPIFNGSMIMTVHDGEKISTN